MTDRLKRKRCEQTALGTMTAFPRMLMAAIVLTVAPARHLLGRGDRSRCSAEERDLRLGTGGDPRPWPRQEGQSLGRDPRTCEPRGRQDRASRRQRRYHRLRLAVGVARARAWRQADLLSVFERARRRDGAGRIPDPDIGRSQGPQARRRRRPDRQELAAAAGVVETGRHRPQVGVDDRLRRAAIADGQDAQRRNGCDPQLLEFLRRAGSQGLPSRRRHRGSAAETRRQRPHRDARLCLRRNLGGGEPGCRSRASSR